MGVQDLDVADILLLLQLSDNLINFKIVTA